MRISKGDPNFENFVVIQRTRTWWQRWLRLYTETELTGVLEADDADGKITRHVMKDGCAVFVKQGEEICMTNTVKLMMLDPMVRGNFIRAGFAPKVTVTYESGIKIINRNPSAALQVVEEKLDALELRSEEAKELNAGRTN